jgi:putative sterol carrier protein
MGNPIGTDSLVMSFKTMFDSRAAAGFKAEIGLVFGDDRFVARVAGGKLEIDRGEARAPDAVIETDSNTLAALVYGGEKLADLQRGGKLRLEGDRNVVKRFTTLFPMPTPAPATAPAGLRP